MSTHAYTVPDVDAALRIVRAVDAALPRRSFLYDAPTLTFTFTPDLTAAEVSALDALVRAARSILTREERDAIESDVALLRTFQGIASPTLAQTAAATKAQSRILRVLLRD